MWSDCFSEPIDPLWGCQIKVLTYWINAAAELVSLCCQMSARSERDTETGCKCSRDSSEAQRGFWPRRRTGPPGPALRLPRCSPPAPPTYVPVCCSKIPGDTKYPRSSLLWESSSSYLFRNTLNTSIYNLLTFKIPCIKHDVCQWGGGTDCSSGIIDGFQENSSKRWSGGFSGSSCRTREMTSV